MSRLPNKIYTNDLKPVEVKYRNTVSPEEFLRDNFGGALSHVPELDGKIHRFRPEGSRDEDGWYVFFESDGYIFGSAGDWRRNDSKIIYKPEGNVPQSVLRSISEKSKIAEAEKAEMEKEALETLRMEWPFAPECTEAPYLSNKGVGVYGDLRKVDDCVIVPMYASDGSLVNRQKIYPDGKKRFGAFLETKGARFIIEGSGATYLCEGYATGASIHEATGAEVIVCFSANNLPKVAKDYPGATVIADNDQSGTGEEYAKKTGLPYVLIPVVGMDANDFAMAYGTEELEKVIAPKRKKDDRWIIPYSEWEQMRSKPKWLIKGYVPEGEGTSMIFGPSGCGKTFVVIDMMMHILTGTDWHGHKVKRGSVAYFCGEGHSGIPLRINAWFQEHGYTKEEQNEFLKDFFISNRTVDMYDPAEMKLFLQYFESLKRLFDLVVIDTLNRHFSGDENKADDIHVFLSSCEGINEVQPKAHVLIVHHTGIASEKENRARGNSALRGAMQVELMVTKNPDTNQVMLKQTKQKDIELMQDRFFSFSSVTLPETDDDGENYTSAVLVSDEEERKPVDMQSIRANLLLSNMVKTAHEMKSRDVDVDPDDGRTIVSSTLLISVAKTFYCNGGMEPPYKDEYDLIKPKNSKNFVSAYLKERVENFAKGWWKLV